MKNEYFGTQQVYTCAKVVILVKCKTLRQWPVKCKNLNESLAPIIQCQTFMRQVEIFLFDHTAQVLYNYCIDEKETKMTTADFFADFAYDQYSEFVDAELREIFQCSNTQDENFDLDVPF
jgi:hypothetical protein